MAKIVITGVAGAFEMSFGTEAVKHGMKNIKSMSSKVVVSIPDDSAYVEVNINGRNHVRMTFDDVDTPAAIDNDALYVAVAALI